MQLFFNVIILYVNKYYHDVWLNENITWQTPHQDEKISSERGKCLKRYYPSPDERQAISMEYARFSCVLGASADPESLRDRVCGSKVLVSSWFLNSKFTSVGFKASRPIMFLLLLWKELEYIVLYSLLKEEQSNPDMNERSSVCA